MKKILFILIGIALAIFIGWLISGMSFWEVHPLNLICHRRWEGDDNDE